MRLKEFEDKYLKELEFSVLEDFNVLIERATKEYHGRIVREVKERA